MFQNAMENLNNNKFFIGSIMIFLTIGGRFIITELTEEQKSILLNPVVRKFFIFCAFFMATRDIQCALILTIIFILVVGGLFNGDVFFLTDKENEKYDTITNDKKIDTIIEELNQMKKVI
jgi:ABC-type spermidine/putrescine transport system permease subunit I